MEVGLERVLSTGRVLAVRKELPKLAANRRAFGQATIRHAVFGIVLGLLEDALNVRTAGVYLRADASDLEVLDGGSEEERAELIAQRLREWKSAANAF